MKLAGARGITRSRVPLIALMALAAIGMAGCEGDDGKTGAQGPGGDPGAPGATGPTGPTGPAVDLLAQTKVETCNFCHNGSVVRSGQSHQAIHDSFTDASNLDIEFVAYSRSGATAPYTVAVTFQITQNGQPFVDVAGLPKLPVKSFYASTYDSATRTFAGNTTITVNSTTTVPTGGPGQYTVTKTDFAYAPDMTDAVIYGQIAQTPINIEDSQYDPGAGKRIVMYDNRASTSWPFGDVGTYVSAANVESCEACHGKPYMKHGNITAVNEGSPDFVSCKTCHNDAMAGSHLDWQWMVDDPLAWATDNTPADYATRYAYKRTLMNDVHMSHAMEFPYPQSMANCNKCHEGKLDVVLADEKFTAETCKSCHPMQVQDPKYVDEKRAPSFGDLWNNPALDFHDIGMGDCNDACHKAGGYARSFDEMHSGYDKGIYREDGTRYSDLYDVSLDSVTKTGDVVNFKFSANDASIVPELIVSFYGYDTKDMLVSSHTRGQAPAGTTGLRMEFVVTDADNALFTQVATADPLTWEVNLNLAAYQQPTNSGLASIPTLISQGKIERMEVSILPELSIDGEEIAIEGAAQTYTVTASSATALNNWFKGPNAIADTAKCNACHDMLGTTFHIGSGYGSVGVSGCRNCHVPTSGGSHLEMQSRSIDSYVHSIHAFQAFDTGWNAANQSGTDFTDPVVAKRYSLHVGHTWPLFTANACEGCHVPGKFDYANNATSLPSLHSASSSWNVPRAVGPEPQYVTGPGSRACGGCHRAYPINQDDAAGLATFNAHMADEGYLIDNTTANPSTTTWIYRVIDKIMGSVN